MYQYSVCTVMAIHTFHLSAFAVCPDTQGQGSIVSVPQSKKKKPGIRLLSYLNAFKFNNSDVNSNHFSLLVSSNPYFIFCSEAHIYCTHIHTKHLSIAITIWFVLFLATAKGLGLFVFYVHGWMETLDSEMAFSILHFFCLLHFSETLW